MPIARSAATECWVGLVLISWADAIYGTRVTWMKQHSLRRGSSPNWRIASKNGRPSMSPTVPPISHRTMSAVLGVVLDEFLDGVGDVRDHLDRAAQIVAVALAGEHGPVDATCRDRVGGTGRHAGETLVMAEVEVGLGPVVGDEDLAVLVGRHRARGRR